ncbi:MAG: hypothetical protein ABW123_18795 [Cystobacter sp.]
MHLKPLAALALGMTLALPALAKDKPQDKPNSWRVVCATNTADGSRAVQGTTLIIEAGEKVKDAISVDGDVILRKGAEVEDAVAIRGRVILEPGARVRGQALALGGDVRVHKGARVEGDATALGGRLVVDAADGVAGEKNSLAIQFGGRELISGFIQDALDEDVGCRIIDDEKKD